VANRGSWFSAVSFSLEIAFAGGLGAGALRFLVNYGADVVERSGRSSAIWIFVLC